MFARKARDIEKLSRVRENEAVNEKMSSNEKMSTLEGSIAAAVLRRVLA